MYFRLPLPSVCVSGDVENKGQNGAENNFSDTGITLASWLFHGVTLA